MKRTLVGLAIALMLGFFLTLQVRAHTPLCSCYDNADGTITCEGGFSDGSSGAGVAMRVEDENGEIISVVNEDGEGIRLEGKMDEYSEFTFIKPDVPYKVIFDAGPGHTVEIEGEDITE